MDFRVHTLMYSTHWSISVLEDALFGDAHLSSCVGGHVDSRIDTTPLLWAFCRAPLFLLTIFDRSDAYSCGIVHELGISKEVSILYVDSRIPLFLDHRGNGGNIYSLSAP